MAKLAQQDIIFRLSKAVTDDSTEKLSVLDTDALEQLKEAVAALAGDDSIIVEYFIEG